MKNPDPEYEICDQGLGFTLPSVWTFLARIILVIWKYLHQINANIYINIFT